MNHLNLQLTTGTGNTYTPNGYGNLIVGYGTNFGGVARTGSHDIVVGDDHGWSGSGGVVFGWFNQIAGAGATVTGGQDNVASGENSSVTGGWVNTASGHSSTVSGGNGGTVNGRSDWRAGDPFQDH